MVVVWRGNDSAPLERQSLRVPLTLLSVLSKNTQ